MADGDEFKIRKFHLVICHVLGGDALTRPIGIYFETYIFPDQSILRRSWLPVMFHTAEPSSKFLGFESIQRKVRGSVSEQKI